VSRALRWVLVVVAVLVLLVIAALAAVPYLVDTPRIQALIASQASQALGRPVQFAAVSVRVLPLPAVVLKELRVAEDPAFGKDPFLRLDEARVRLKLWPLLLGRVELGDFLLKQPVISLVQAADGRWNISTLGGPAPEARAPAKPRGGGGAGAAAVLGTRVKIDDGVVTYESRAGGRAARYRVEGLDLTLTPGVGTVGVQGDFKVMPGDVGVKIADGTVALTGGRALTDAPVRARVTVNGKNLGALGAVALGPEPALAGGIKAALAVAGTVGKPKASGDVELSDFAVSQTSPQCPEPRRRTLTLGTVKLNVAWEDSRLTARPVTTGLGGGSITTNVATVLDGTTRVELTDLGIKGVPVEKVLVDYLCQGYAVTGPLDLAGAASTRLGALWTALNGNGQLRLGPGKVVGAQALAVLANVVRVGGAVSSLLGGELPASFASSPLDFESITATYTITNGVVSTRDFLFTSRAMKVAAAGTYALPSNTMNLDVVVSTGRGEVRGKVTGNASSPSIRVNPANILRDVKPEQVEKGLQDLLKRFR
jgi:AsmA protein